MRFLGKLQNLDVESVTVEFLSDINGVFPAWLVEIREEAA